MIIRNSRISGESFEFYLTPGLWQNISNLRALKQVHAAMVVNGFESSNSALRKFIFAAAIAVPSAVVYAQKAFTFISRPDFFMWNTIIKGCATCPSAVGGSENAVILYAKMFRRRHRRRVGGFFGPSFVAHQYAIKACADISWVGFGLGLHGRVVKLGLAGDWRVRNSLVYFHSHSGELSWAGEIFRSIPADRDSAAAACLIKGLAKQGRMDLAREVFDEMPQRTIFCFNVMITGYSSNGDLSSARRVFDSASEKNTETWNALISGLVSNGSNLSALRTFEEMRRRTTTKEDPNEVTFLSLLSACSKLGYLRIGKWVHKCLMESSTGDRSLAIGNALVQMYTSCGSLESASEVFRGMKTRDATSWNSLMRGFLRQGRAEEVHELFREMNVEPNEITFLEILVACSHTGRVDDGIEHFNLMRTKFGIRPNARHYSCLVDMFGRVGMLDEAMKLIQTMEVEPNEKVWRFLVRACRIHRNFELGKYARAQLRRFGGQ